MSPPELARRSHSNMKRIFEFNSCTGMGDGFTIMNEAFIHKSVENETTQRILTFTLHFE